MEIVERAVGKYEEFVKKWKIKSPPASPFWRSNLAGSVLGCTAENLPS